uniref:Uncharacterized protein n=1 Tax=Romanomermis culicivorax TaxID=13658 RepID=A0A915HYB7_ROMCU
MRRKIRDLEVHSSDASTLAGPAPDSLPLTSSRRQSPKSLSSLTKPSCSSRRCTLFLEVAVHNFKSDRGCGALLQKLLMLTHKEPIRSKNLFEKWHIGQQSTDHYREPNRVHPAAYSFGSSTSGFSQITQTHAQKTVDQFGVRSFQSAVDVLRCAVSNIGEQLSRNGDLVLKSVLVSYSFTDDDEIGTADVRLTITVYNPNS